MKKKRSIVFSFFAFFVVLGVLVTFSSLGQRVSTAGDLKQGGLVSAHVLRLWLAGSSGTALGPLSAAPRSRRIPCRAAGRGSCSGHSVRAGHHSCPSLCGSRSSLGWFSFSLPLVGTRLRAQGTLQSREPVWAPPCWPPDFQLGLRRRSADSALLPLGSAGAGQQPGQ